VIICTKQIILHDRGQKPPKIIFTYDIEPDLSYDQQQFLKDQARADYWTLPQAWAQTDKYNNPITKLFLNKTSTYRHLSLFFY